ncbi:MULTISPECIES: SDR family NAD(P)-dependent oxidoreductase [Thermus]|jgi:NAD(P)-dependent dehydrogenase (short-subunit alcohol dehydrogenase family)|uniref:Dehydrogenase n=1 Tax=Thermus brockianus TaxID=56956 RepID=A0A1J0LWK7_THEBO|nr:SDR family NAD(P)-dependent oxidoreductase [Thermus brockianus]APD09853.1 short-chain dehydrogenase/reductase family protein [Thermus brockianus]BDG16835.1 dehydrogenase [Thermus brockianus]
MKKTLILTGASRGIGKALALELAKAGYDLVLNARSEGPLKAVAEEVAALGGRALYVAGSAGKAEVAESLVGKAESLGNFFGYIHNAGVLHPGPLLYEIAEPLFMEVLEANLLAGYQLARFAYPLLRRRGEGLAVYVGSGAAETNLPGIGAYAVAKAAEEHLARQLAAEVPEIACFVYRPGVVETEMQRQAREAQGSAASVLQRVFRGYKEEGLLLTPEEAAKALVRLLPKARQYHGKTASWRDA